MTQKITAQEAINKLFPTEKDKAGFYSIQETDEPEVIRDKNGKLVYKTTV